MRIVWGSLGALLLVSAFVIVTSWFGRLIG